MPLPINPQPHENPTFKVWCLDNDDMAIDVSRHLLDSLEEEDITAHERRRGGRIGHGLMGTQPSITYDS